MAMTAPNEPLEFDPVPGVDVVSGAATSELESRLLTDRVLTVAATVHRRLLDRRADLLRSRTTPASAPVAPASWSALAPQDLDLVRGPDFCVADGVSWAGRLNAQRVLAESTDDGVAVTRVRGWDRTDGAVLVDGRAIAGCILDTTIALEHQARRFEAGERPLALCLPDVRTGAEARHWNTMLGRIQDRLGIPRDAVPVVVTLETPEAIDHADSILAEFRSSCVGVCVAVGADLDEVAAKEIAEARGVRWIGAIPGSLDII